MKVLIAGGHGKIALLLARQLSAAGHQAYNLVRNADHAPELRATGAEPVLFDLERGSADDLGPVLADVDAVVFAAGAGPGSGLERKYSVDLGGSVLLADACRAAGVRAFVQISTIGAGEPPAAGSDEVWAAYLDAKTKAEDDLRARDLDWTIVRPGRLTDDPGTGRVRLENAPAAPGSVPRADVAAVITELLINPAPGRTLVLTGGDVPVGAAVAALRREQIG
ncbi:NAD-dependent dehydratase [Microlunatus endophyticus]|uniref:NAD-dependent dehydratase n=2 Tax=Microlunatus endophyticus TaxID=1716077 RepID=A0A917S0E6_9ACTN|nr:NAD-dependent dehydratase [Microlunatus endophyticus]